MASPTKPMTEPPSYVQIPEYATVVPYDPPESSSPTTVRGEPSVSLSSTPLPTSGSPSPVGGPQSPSSMFNLSSLVLNQAMASFPGPLPNQPRKTTQGQQPLLSAKDPLSIPITTMNFRRFISRCGPIFWLQDRVEEILFWRKGWQYTSAWMAGYAFLCYFPRMILLLPHFTLLFVLFTTYERKYPVNEESAPEAPVPTLVSQPTEGTVDWYANLQAIQSLMGLISDAYDLVVPVIPHLSWVTPNTSPIFLITFITFFTLIPVVHFIPLRPLFLALGLTPFVVTHPIVLSMLPRLINTITPYIRVTVEKVINDDKLLEKHWGVGMKEVAVWENERWTQAQGWKSANLRVGERKPWTRGQDGWSGAVEGSAFDGTVSNLTFALPRGWDFVETEDWRVDLAGGWCSSASDNDGWVYTDDAWLNPSDEPLSEWKSTGMTRRRKWMRRIYAVTS